MTQLDQLVAIFEAIPGDTTLWLDLSKRLDDLKRKADPMYKGPEKDGSIDETTWGHLRNIAREVRSFSQALAAMERGDDPDIPF